MGKSHGTKHGRSNAFIWGTPLGNIDLFKFGELRSAGKDFRTADGQPFAAGEEEAHEVECAMYMGNAAQVQIVLNYHRLFKTATEGYDFASTKTTLGDSNKPASVWQIARTMVTQVAEVESDQENPGPAFLRLTLLVYGAVKTL